MTNTALDVDDCRFVASASGTIHERDEWDGDGHDYEHFVRCRQRLPAGSTWDAVDVDSVADAVIEHDLAPCGRCFARPLWSSPGPDVIDAARREMEYRDVEGSFGQTFGTSFPAQLRFENPTPLDADRVLAALDLAGIAVLDAEDTVRRKADRGHFETEVCWRHNYERHKVRVNGSRVRIYPYDAYIPGRRELADLLGALVWAYDAPLSHDPMDRDGGDA